MTTTFIVRRITGRVQRVTVNGTHCTVPKGAAQRVGTGKIIGHVHNH